MPRPPDDHPFRRPIQPSPATKLTPQQRDEIRERLVAGESAKALATEYGVSASTIRKYL